MTNMPVENLEYYALLESYIGGYYEIEKKEKAKEAANKYQENLNYDSDLKVGNYEHLF